MTNFLGVWPYLKMGGHRNLFALRACRGGSGTPALQGHHQRGTLLLPSPKEGNLVCRSGSKDPLRLLGKSCSPLLLKPGWCRGWEGGDGEPQLSSFAHHPCHFFPALPRLLHCLGLILQCSSFLSFWGPAHQAHFSLLDPCPPLLPPTAAPKCPLTCWSGMLPKVPRIRRAVGVPVAMSHSHVLEAVVLGGRRGGVGQPVGLMAEPIAGAVPLGRA